MLKMSEDLVAQLVDPADAALSAGSNTKVSWRCPKDPRHVWTAAPNTRRRSPKCPVCLNRIVLADVNSLRATDPDLAAQMAEPERAAQVHRGSHAQVEWICPVDRAHRWHATVVSRTRLGAGCPFCSGRRPVVGVGDLATTHPDLVSELVDPEQAHHVGAGSTTELIWRCRENPEHTWSAPVRNRARADRPTGCPHCAGRTGRPYRRRPTLGQLDSPLLDEAVDRDLVASLSSGSGRVVAWHCSQCAGGHTYEMSVRHRMRGQGCPVRAGTQVLAGINDLATTHPDLARELVDASQATSLSRGSTTAVPWRCPQGHVWSTPVYARVAGNGCPQCCPIGSSRGEHEVLAAVRALDPSASHRVRLPGDVEADVVCGSLAVAFNGVFWHSEAAGHTKDDHVRKLRAVHEAGLSLLTIWEDDWADALRRAIIVRTLAHRLHRTERLFDAFEAAGVDPHERDPMLLERRGARTLTPCIIDGTEAAQFFRHHHVQGPVALTRSFALCDEQGRARAVLGLRSPSHSARSHRPAGCWEIQRYATAGSVPGGFSRLLAHAERVLREEGHELTQWVTLSADESFDGRLYAASGFEVEAHAKPSYWYAGGALRSRRAPKEAFQLRRFRSDDALVYEEGWSELEAAAANGMHRVWDAGKTRWIKSL